jgi:hypothetical protein
MALNSQGASLLLMLAATLGCCRPRSQTAGIDPSVVAPGVCGLYSTYVSAGETTLVARVGGFSCCTAAGTSCANYPLPQACTGDGGNVTCVDPPILDPCAPTGTACFAAGNGFPWYSRGTTPAACCAAGTRCQLGTCVSTPLGGACTSDSECVGYPSNTCHTFIPSMNGAPAVRECAPVNWGQ